MANNIAVAVTADVADLTAKMAVAKATMQDAGREMRAVAKDIAAGDTSTATKTRSLEVADRYSKAASTSAIYARELKALSQVQETANGLSGQQRMSMIVVGEQFRQMSTEVALGIPAMQIFSQQAGQTIQALSGIAAEGSAVGAFLTGGWGIAMTTAVAVLAPLIASTIQLTSAQDQALEKLKEDAKKTQEARAAKEIFERSEEGVTAAIYDQQAALAKQAEGLKTEAERSYDAARAERDREVQIRRTTEALLQQADAEYKSAQSQTFGAAGGAGAGMATAMYAQQDIDMKARLKAAQEAVKIAEQNVVGARSFLDVEHGKAAGDPVESIKRKYEGAGGLIEQARIRAVAEGKVGGELERQVKALAEQERHETDAARKAEHPRKGPKGPSEASEWEGELRAQQIASGEYFKDQTAEELAFWQSKLGLTKQGSAQWLQVQGHIFEASRQLAREDYQQNLADLNDRLEANRNNWTSEQAVWQEKLAYIRKTFGAESAEYKNAHREMERAQREHDDREIAAAQQHAQKMVDALKHSTEAQANVRESDARAAESILRSGGGGFADNVTSEQQIAKIHAQLAQQKMADTEALHTAEAAALDTAIAQAQARYGDDQARYQNLLDAKAQADQRYADQKAALEAQSRQQSIQDILAIQSAYRGYLGTIVGTSVTAFDGLISGQKTWADAGISIYRSVVQQVEQQVARMVTNWIVQHALMTATQGAQLAIQSSQTVASEAAKTAAVTTGVVARTSATMTGATQSAAIVGKHNLKEITSHAATAAAAAYHALAGIPVVGPMLGGAAAAATFVAVEAYGALASFDKGTNFVPNDMVAQIHAGERIVPAADNRELMSAVRGGGNRGDVNLHYSPTVNGALPFADQLGAHEDNIISIVQNASRRGAFRF